jgi:HlyD family secretion protein
LKKLLLAVALLAAGAAALWIYLRQTSPPAVSFASVVRETLVDTLVTNGKAEPIQWVAVHSQTEGPVIRVHVDLGQQVAKGAPLVEVESLDARSDLVAAEARVAQARAELENTEQGGRAGEIAAIESELKQAQLEVETARRDVASLERLVEKKAGTRQELEAARDRLRKAEAEIEALRTRRSTLVVQSDRSVAQARLRDAEMAVAAARDRIEQSVIRAPMAGTIYALQARMGTFLTRGALVANVGILDRMRVFVYVDEPELGRVRVGMPVTITWDAKPGRQWTGTVDTVPTEIRPLGTRQVGEVVCIVENSGNELPPGANINATIRAQEAANTLTIPIEALRRENSQTGVYVLQGERVEWRPVKPGISGVTRVQILEGLKEGERVALGTDRPLSNGQHVRPV